MCRSSIRVEGCDIMSYSGLWSFKNECWERSYLAVNVIFDIKGGDMRLFEMINNRRRLFTSLSIG